MTHKRLKNLLLLISIIALVCIVGYFVLIKKSAQVVYTPTQNTEPATYIEYINNQFGFTFTLPVSWKGYSIVNKNWEGQMIDSPTTPGVEGPEILIRNPLWTSKNPRQDIPIMIFTPAQWNLIQEEKLSLGAAPIGPSELGQNTKYVFALPARYNFAFLTGFEEVEKILENKPLNAF